MKYIPDQIQTHEIKDATLESGDMSKKVIHVNAGAPAKTDDTGLGYEQGSIWSDSTNGDMYICTDHTAEDAIWHNMEGDDVNLVQFTAGASTGFLMGGIGATTSPTTTDTIQTIDLTSDGDSVDTTDELTEIHYNSSGAKSAAQIFCAGAYPDSTTDRVEAYTIASPHTYSDWGEITVDAGETAVMSSSNNDTYAWIVGGQPGSNSIQKWATASAASTTDVGNTVLGIHNQVGVTDSIGGFGYTFAGYVPGPSVQDEMTRFSLTSDGDAADVGDLTQATGHTSCCPDPSYAFIVEGGNPGITDIDRFAWGSSGNATDVGEASRVQNSAFQTPTIHTTTHWYQVGGYTHPATAYSDTIDKITIASPHTLTDVGEMVDVSTNGAAASV